MVGSSRQGLLGLPLHGLQKCVMCGALLPSAIVWGLQVCNRSEDRRPKGISALVMSSQELLPRGLDIKQEELGDLVDKEMAATSAAIEAATARIEVWECLQTSYSDALAATLWQHFLWDVSQSFIKASEPPVKVNQNQNSPGSLRVENENVLTKRR